MKLTISARFTDFRSDCETVKAIVVNAVESREKRAVKRTEQQGKESSTWIQNGYLLGRRRMGEEEVLPHLKGEPELC